jgi:hypothetical protein
MKKDVHFWMATVARGILAVITGSAVMVIPDMARTLLLLPFAIVISILCLAAYGVLDSVVVFITSFMVSSRVSKVALRLQGTFGVIVGVLLFTVVYDRVLLPWFLYLIAFHALCTTIAEFVVARHAFTRSTTVWNYAAAAVALLFLVAYTMAATVFVDSLSARDIAWLIYGYLLALGLAQCLIAARMLYADCQLMTLAQADHA